MNVVVCVKQIPDPATPYKLEEGTNWLVRPDDQVLDEAHARLRAEPVARRPGFVHDRVSQHRGSEAEAQHAREHCGAREKQAVDAVLDRG